MGLPQPRRLGTGLSLDGPSKRSCTCRSRRAHSVTLLHNHPSGDPDPSTADLKVTRELVQTGRLLKIEVLDHLIIGRPGHRSLREMGYFH